jgi:hypothetical protein
LVAGDYGLENLEWNGLSEFLRLADSHDIELRPVSTLDYATLGPDDRLIVIYPTRELPAEQFAEFVVDGGRVLLFDDFGASTQILNRLDVERLPASSIPHNDHHLGRPGLPIFRPVGKHPLLVGVQEVVANHPSALRTSGGPILPFEDPSAGLVYDMRLGRGKVVVVGDASLLINHMLLVGDNRKFLGNALRYLCRDVEGECRPFLLVGDVSLTGEYAAQSDPRQDAAEWTEDALAAINRWVDRLSREVPPENALYYGSILLMIGVVVFVIIVFPWRRRRAVAPDVGPPSEVRPLSEFEWNLLRYRRGRRVNHALPMSILKAEFERLFFREVRGQEPIPQPESPRRAAFLKVCAQRYMDTYRGDLAGGARKRVSREVLALLRLFSGIPPRHRLFLDSEAHFSERELMGAWRRSRGILEVMGVDDEYEQRTRRAG